jgi:acyl-CoA thioester hydrolase
MAGQVHRCSHRVTYAECTVGDHVYYGRYLDILEAARGEFFRSLGLPFRALQDQDTALPVIECALQFKSPARYDDVLMLETWLTELGRIRVAFSHRILKADGQLVLTASTVHACTSLAEKPKRLPDDLRQRLLPFLHMADAPADSGPP